VSTNRTGLYPGTFDPPTSGHLDIIKRALHVVDRLIMGVAINAGKSPMFCLEERVSMVQRSIKGLGGDAASRVDVQPFDSLLMHFSKKCGATIIIRGLRAVSDFEYEFQMAGMNSHLEPNIETVFLMASEQTQFISSRLVKEICMLGGDITDFVPKNVKERLLERVNKVNKT
jgi:pantetheine-phosphate adenylyltransferase